MRKIVIAAAGAVMVAVACAGGGTGTPVTLPGRVTNKGTTQLQDDTINVVLEDFAFSPTFLPSQKLVNNLQANGRARAYTGSRRRRRVHSGIRRGRLGHVRRRRRKWKRRPRGESWRAST